MPGGGGRRRGGADKAQLMVWPVVSMPAMKKTETSLHRRAVDSGWPSLSLTLIKFAQMLVSESAGSGLLQQPPPHKSS